MVSSHPALSARVMKSVSIGFHRVAAALVATKAQRAEDKLDDGQYRWLSSVMCRTLVHSFPRFVSMMAVPATVIARPGAQCPERLGQHSGSLGTAFSVLLFVTGVLLLTLNLAFS